MIHFFSVLFSLHVLTPCSHFNPPQPPAPVSSRALPSFWRQPINGQLAARGDWVRSEEIRMSVPDPVPVPGGGGDAFPSLHHWPARRCDRNHNPNESSLESDNVGVPLGVQEHEDLDGPLLAVAAADEELGLLVGELGQARASLCVAPGTERAIDFLGLPPVLPWRTAALQP